MTRETLTPNLPRVVAGLALLFTVMLVGSALAGIKAEVTITKGDGNSDNMWSDPPGNNWKPWWDDTLKPNDTRTLETCQWIKVGTNGGLEATCRCGIEGCTCKLKLPKRGKFHIPDQWGDNSRQDEPTLYDVSQGILQIRGGAPGPDCGPGTEGCDSYLVGFDTPVARAWGQSPEPPGLVSWFAADYDSGAAQARILNHPMSPVPMLSHGILWPDTVPIFPGEGLIYNMFGIQPATVGIFVNEDPEGMPGEWAPLEFEIVNTGVVESFFDIFLWNDLGWPMGTQSYGVLLYPGESFFAMTEVHIPLWAPAHTVCPVGASASSWDDEYKHWALLSVMPDVTIELVPLATVLHHGENLQLIAHLRNNTAIPQTIEAWTEVILPNGNPYGGNPVAGPKTPTIGPYGVIVRDVSHTVPGAAPLGTYYYTGYLGEPGTSDILDWNGFSFDIVE